MLEKTIIVNNKSGLHARPASQLTELAQNYNASVRLYHNSVEADAKSIISLLSAGIKRGTTVLLVCDGEDEQEALKDVAALIEGFTE